MSKVKILNNFFFFQPVEPVRQVVLTTSLQLISSQCIHVSTLSLDPRAFALFQSIPSGKDRRNPIYG